MVLLQLTGTEDRKKEATWYDVGIIKGTSCTVSSYYLPSGELEKSEIDLEVRPTPSTDGVNRMMLTHLGRSKYFIIRNILSFEGRGVPLKEAGAGARHCLQVPGCRDQRLRPGELVRDLRLQNLSTR